MKKLVIIIIAILALGTKSYAQTAKENYFSAVKAYKNGNYTGAVQYLDKVVQQLGSTNIRVQPLLVKSLAGMQNWRRTKTEIANYYNLNPDTTLFEYQEMQNLEKEAEKKIREDEQLYSSVKDSKSVSEYQSYLDQFPYGKYRSEVEDLLSKQNEENAWQTAKNKGTIYAYYAYLDKYPGGKYANTAKETIKRMDKEAYNNAVSEGTQQSLRYYLNHYPHGEYRDAVQQKLDEKITYMNAKTHKDYEEYIEKYPYGEYVDEAKQKIKEFDKDAFFSASNKNTSTSYNNYIRNFPNGLYRTQAEEKYRKRKRWEKYITHVEQRPFVLTVNYNFSDTIVNPRIGLAFGKIFWYSDKSGLGLGAYVSKRGYGYFGGALVNLGGVTFKFGYGQGAPEFRWIDKDDKDKGMEPIPANEQEVMNLFDFYIGGRVSRFTGIHIGFGAPFTGGYSTMIGVGLDFTF